MYEQTYLYRQRKNNTNGYEFGHWTVCISVVHAKDLKEALYYKSSLVSENYTFQVLRYRVYLPKR
jgi:hypothetical protein